LLFRSRPELIQREARTQKKDRKSNRLRRSIPSARGLSSHNGSPGDLILASFAGSGTTGAVTYNMGRRSLMVELGEHCYLHIIPRL